MALSDDMRETGTPLPTPVVFSELADHLRRNETIADIHIKAARNAIVGTLSALPNFSFAHFDGMERPFKDVLIRYLSRRLPLDKRLEQSLTNLRRALLFHVADGAQISDDGLDLLAALAIFCFDREYVFWETPEEYAAVKKLNLYAGPSHVAAIACYRALHTLHEPTWLLDAMPSSERFANMLRVQLTEPIEERRIASDIRELSPIKDPTSMAVRQMYEENPYPRWTDIGDVELIANPRHLRVLFAGCGSGRQPNGFARANRRADITALDLSRASLAYGIRKSREYGFTNIEFVHGDILELPQSGLEFDFIATTGVLHHMKSPLEGLRALGAVLAADGVIEIALYSEIGRRRLLPAIRWRETAGFPATAEGIRSLRRAVFSAPPGLPIQDAALFPDFYSMSDCRDMLFHVQEHRFNLQQVGELVQNAGLVLREIAVSKKVGDKYRDSLPAGLDPDIEAWSRFEAAHPDAFTNMYRIAATKPVLSR